MGSGNRWARLARSIATGFARGWSIYGASVLGIPWWIDVPGSMAPPFGPLSDREEAAWQDLIDRLE